MLFGRKSANEISVRLEDFPTLTDAAPVFEFELYIDFSRSEGGFLPPNPLFLAELHASPYNTLPSRSGCTQKGTMAFSCLNVLSMC